MSKEINVKIDKWIQELTVLTNDDKFDWIELKPIISQPDVLL